MQKNLFTRYFSICASLILVCITTLGIILMAFASNYFSEDKFRLLESSLSNIVNITQDNLEYNNHKYVDSSVVRNGYKIVSDFINADVFLIDMSGKTLVCSGSENNPNFKTYTIPSYIINDVAENGKYMNVGKLGKIYKENYYIVGMPITGEGGNVISEIFIATSANDLTEFLQNILKMFAISAIVVMGVAFIAIYFVTKRMVKPLRDMLDATMSFGKGDFSVRVPVKDMDEIGQLGVAFNNMATSLASLESVRRSFIANVSHELKTPMQTIAGFIDGILDGTIPQEKHKKYLEIVSSEVKRLSRVVHSMLNIARIEAGEMSITPTAFDINDVVLKTIFTFEQTLEAKNIDVRGLDTGKIMVEADKDLVHQVIYNLVENAVKFVNQDGYIEVIYNAQKDRTYIGIKNSGMGIPKEEIPKVFDRFYKTDKSRGLDKKGVGLGLYIVRSIVNLHKGEIIVRSVEGEYCEFMFSVPSQSQGKNSKKQ